MEKTQQNLDNYAKQGLRVLVMAKRVLPEDEYMEWLSKHRDAEVGFGFGFGFSFGWKQFKVTMLPT
jgi:hypothetical protein